MPALDFCRTVGRAATSARSLRADTHLRRGAASNGENCSRGYLLREENVNTYFQGRKIAAAQDYERPSMEALRLIRKLRWIGMEEEAERAETQLHESTLAGGVVTAAHETD